MAWRSGLPVALSFLVVMPVSRLLAQWTGGYTAAVGGQYCGKSPETPLSAGHDFSVV
jgi:hypothetical protein